MLAFRVAIVSGSPDFIVAVVLVALCANVIQVAVVAPMGAR